MTLSNVNFPLNTNDLGFFLFEYFDIQLIEYQNMLRY